MRISLYGMLVLTIGLNTLPSFAKPFDTVGLYSWRDAPDQHAFWKASGIDMLQFCDTGWHFRDDMLDDYYKKFASEVDSAQKAGFKVYVILFSNIKQWTGPEEHGDGLGLRYHPDDRVEMDARLKYIAKTVRAMKAADGFTFFAGDPGGVPTELGKSDVYKWMSMAKEVESVVKKEAPKAKYNVNTWAITQWQHHNLGAFGKDFWLKEMEITKAVMEEDGFIGPFRGIEIPPHNYYRSLALKVFNEEKMIPTLFPNISDIRDLKKRNTERVWVWPYFLLDEADDGYIGSVWGNRGMLQIETRYIHKLVRDMQKIGANGIIGSWSWAGYLPNALNTYAFGRFCNDQKIRPNNVIDEYAGFIAEEESKESLAQIMKFVENNSTWNASLPMKYRLPAFDTGDLLSANLALVRLDRIKLREKGDFPLPEPAVEYIKHLRVKLKDIALTERVPEFTVETSSGELIAMTNGNWVGDDTSVGGLDESCTPAADKACAVVCTIPDTGFPSRFDIPVELKKEHHPKKLKVSYVKGIQQNNNCIIYWDDIPIAEIDAYSSDKQHIETVEIDLPDDIKSPVSFQKGNHLLSLSVKTEPFWIVNYFKINSILIPD